MGGEAGAAGLPSRAGGHHRLPGSCHGDTCWEARSAPRGQQDADRARGTANAQSGQPGVHPGRSVPASGSLAAGLSFRPRMPRCRVPPGKVAIENSQASALHPPSLPSDLIGVFPGLSRPRMQDHGRPRGAEPGP